MTKSSQLSWGSKTALFIKEKKIWVEIYFSIWHAGPTEQETTLTLPDTYSGFLSHLCLP